MIYLDMDGVVADFNRHTRDLKIPYNYQWYDPRETWTPETLEGERIKNEHMNSKEFWETMPLMPDAMELYFGVVDYDPFFLTAKPRDDSPETVYEGKLAFIRKHFMENYPADRLIVCRRHEKPNYVGRTGHRMQILVDDDTRNIKTWVETKGIDTGQKAFGVHFVSAKQSLNQIDAILRGVHG